MPHSTLAGSATCKLDSASTGLISRPNPASNHRFITQLLPPSYLARPIVIVAAVLTLYLFGIWVESVIIQVLVWTLKSSERTSKSM